MLVEPFDALGCLTMYIIIMVFPYFFMNSQHCVDQCHWPWGSFTVEDIELLDFSWAISQ